MKYIDFSIKNSLKFIHKCPINNISALVHWVMAWRRPGDKPLSEPMVIILLTHICVTRLQWIKYLCATLQWRHNEQDGVSKHRPHDCLLNRLSRRRSKKTSKLRVTGLCEGIHRWPVNSPHKGPVARKMFPFDDVIMYLMCPFQGGRCTRSLVKACKKVGLARSGREVESLLAKHNKRDDEEWGLIEWTCDPRLLF